MPFRQAVKLRGGSKMATKINGKAKAQRLANAVKEGVSVVLMGEQFGEENTASIGYDVWLKDVEETPLDEDMALSITQNSRIYTGEGAMAYPAITQEIAPKGTRMFLLRWAWPEDNQPEEPVEDIYCVTLQPKTGICIVWLVKETAPEEWFPFRVFLVAV
jgi:hypothetical protein